MIIWQSNTDNLQLEYLPLTHKIVASYGLQVISAWTPRSEDYRAIVREGRQWIIDNRWNGGV